MQNGKGAPVSELPQSPHGVIPVFHPAAGTIGQRDKSFDPVALKPGHGHLGYIVEP